MKFMSLRGALALAVAIACSPVIGADAPSPVFKQVTVNVATGTPPFVISSTSKVVNLYADRAALADTVTTNADLSGDVTSVGNTTTIANNAVTNGKILPNTIANARLNQVPANTVKANATGSTANVADFAMPSCDTATKALQWTTSTGFVCNSSITAATATAFLGLSSGTSGGVPYFSSTSTLASSAALAANALVIGGGAGVAPSTTTTGAGILTFLGTPSSANLASALTDETGSGAAVFGTSPTLTTPNIVGVTNASNAAAGSVGEYVSAELLVGSAVNLTTNTAANVTSVSLTAGDWDCSGNVAFAGTASTVIVEQSSWISTTSATFPTIPNKGGFAQFLLQAGSMTARSETQSIGNFRVNISSTTTVYLSARASFTVAAEGAYGFIGCRRVR